MSEESPQEQKNELRYVGLWYRFAARLIDNVIVSIISSPFLIGIFAVTFKVTFDLIRSGGATGAMDTIHYTRGQSLFVGLCSLGNILVAVLYNVLLTSSKLEGTLGKKLLKIKVNTIDGKRLTLSQAFTRYIATDGLGIPANLLGNSTNPTGKNIGTFFGLLALLYIIVDASVGGADEKKQTVHDRIAKTYVIYR